MKLKCLLLYSLLAYQGGELLKINVKASDPNDVYAVKVVATVTGTSPWQISLSWPSHTGATYEVRRKTTAAGTWGSPVSGSSTGYIDTSGLSAGSVYEYEVKKTFSSTQTGYGYASVSLGASAVESRGRVILIVDNTKAASLTSQLADFTKDLVGDGWSVVRHDVPPDDPNNRSARVTAVKHLIKAEYDGDPTNVKAVILIGHIPVPYSGVFNVDGHSDTLGAHPADAYYGDVVGGSTDWTDSAENFNSIVDRKDNLPSDGKFDQEQLPSTVELQVGRIDFYDLGTAFSTKTETQLLQQYFDKNHQYRQKSRTLSELGLIEDLKVGGYWSDWAPTAIGWGQLSGLLNGPSNIEFQDVGDNFLTRLTSNQKYITQIAGTSQGYDILDNHPTRPYPHYFYSSDFAANDIKTFFIAIGASYISDWDTSDNFLRSALGSASYTLCSFMGDNPAWLIHRLNTGGTWGDAVRVSQNNKRFHVALASDQALPASTYNTSAKRLTATVNGALSATSIDSAATGGNAYNLALGNSVLIKNQTTSAHNGIYYVDQLGDSSKPWILQRVPYADDNQELVNSYCVVASGSSKGTAWVNSSAAGTFDISVPSGTITFQSASYSGYHHRYWNNDMKNGQIYNGDYLNGLNRVHISLLGDPTLRFHVVDPVELLGQGYSISGSSVTLNWTASTDLPSLGTGEGYRVYRSFSRNGPFTRISTGAHTTTTFTQSSVKKGRYVYMIRAVKLTAADDGYYYNLSQGTFVEVDMTSSGVQWTGSELSRTGIANANFTFATGINGGGGISGYYDIYSGGPERKAMHWNGGTPNALSGYWTSSDFSHGYGVNDNYIVIGAVDKYENGGWGTTIRPFRWAMYGGAITLLDPLPLGGNSHGLAINTAGTSVGFGANSQGVSRAIRWDANQTTANDLNTLAGTGSTLQSHAHGVNRAGFVVGRSVNGSSAYRAYVVPPNKSLHTDGIDLGTIGNATGISIAYGINDFNQIVGASQDSTGNYKPFITSPYAGSVTAIPPVSGQTSGYAYGINYSGIVVGESGSKPFIWQEGYSAPIDLNNFKPSTLNLNLQSARAVNYYGSIVGWGFDSANNRRAFILSP